MLFPMLNVLCFYVSSSRGMCAMPNMAVFCISSVSCFPGMLLRYFLNRFQTVPVAPIITGITFVFTFPLRCVSIVRSLYFRISFTSFLITFLSPEISTSINTHVPFSLLRILMFDLLLGMSLSVLACRFINVIALPSRLVSTDFGTCPHQVFLL